MRRLIEGSEANARSGRSRLTSTPINKPCKGKRIRREERGKVKSVTPLGRGHQRGGEGGGEVTMISRGVEVSIAGGVEEMERGSKHMSSS